MSFFIQSFETGESSGIPLDFVNLEGFFFSPLVKERKTQAPLLFLMMSNSLVSKFLCQCQCMV